jgi:hypothetical protein
VSFGTQLLSAAHAIYTGVNEQATWSQIMPSFSGRIKVSLLGAIALWVFARSVFAMEPVMAHGQVGNDALARANAQPVAAARR